ncbi:MAG: Uma2 family endonuclease, partial [Thermosynechococcaceae cyanobacterium]
QDLEVMPDDWGWKRYEIIDGELFVTHAPHLNHQNAGGNLHVALANWSEQTQLGKVFETPGVIFSVHDAVIPDVVWVSHERLASGVDDAGHFTVAPELMIEVLSPGERNEQRDKKAKLKLYSVHGVREYWIVSWQQKSIEVYRRQNTQLQLVTTLLAEDTLTSPLLPEFNLPIAQIFR